MTPQLSADSTARRNVRLFMAFRILFNIRFYYPVFMVMFLRYGITLEQFGLLNAVWAVVIVLLEVLLEHSPIFLAGNLFSLRQQL